MMRNPKLPPGWWMIPGALFGAVVWRLVLWAVLS